MSNTLIDNSKHLKMVDYINNLIKDDECNHIQIATGYWDLPGTALVYDELVKFFKRGGKLDLLIGQEPMLRSYQLSNDISSEKVFPDFYIKRDVNLLTDKYKPVVNLLLDYTNEENEEMSQVRIRVYGQGEKKQFLHAKCYIFTGKCGYGIIGSSNFTEKGLCDNAELNYLETNKLVVSGRVNDDDIKSHQVWFEEMWNQSEPWTGKFIKEILKSSPLGTDIIKERERTLSPYELYIKYLQMQIGDIANAESLSILKSYLPKGYTSLEYQLHAVLQCFYIMKQHGGFILADVVGLGKTVVGLLIIKKFLANAASLGRKEKILIIAPPSIKFAWESTIADFDKDSNDKLVAYINIVTTGSIAKALIDGADDDDGDDFSTKLQYDDYGLILVDESHKFSNSKTQKYKDLDGLINKIRLNTGLAPFVGLLSATPQNNSPADLKNQILLFQREANNSTLPNVPGGKLERFLNDKYTEFKSLRKENTTESKEKLKTLSEEIRDKVLNDLVVRRTRRDIKTHYQEDGKILNFPTVKGPQKLEYEMDAELIKLFADTVNLILGDNNNPPAPHIGYYRYSAIKFFIDEKNTRLYEKNHLKVEQITERLAKMMKNLLVKRLESSFTAFKVSLHNLQSYTQYMIDMINADIIFICPDFNVNDIISEYKGLDKAIPVIQKKIKRRGGNNRCFKSSDFKKEEYLQKLKEDKKLLDELCDRWDKNDYDPKMDRFKKAVDTELFDPKINNPSGYDKPRLVVFSEAIDTVDSITRILENKGHRVLKITSSERKKNQYVIKENFDANSEIRKDDYDVIVATEVLAEGVNLHRANVILNYDTPWNSTRLMQRIGRVNRIGSKEDFVHVFNFFPSEKGNEQIRLKEIAYAKLQAFHTMFGEDNKVFTEDEELSEVEFQHIIDGELSPLSEYIGDLKEFQDNNPQRYQALANIDFVNCGGTISSVDAEAHKSLVIVGAPKRGLTNVLISDNAKADIIAPIKAMSILKCAKDTKYTKSTLDDNIKERALRAYNNHVHVLRTPKDSKAKISQAREFMNEIVRPQLCEDSLLRIFNNIDKMLRNSDYAIAQHILEYKKEYEKNGNSLFEIGEDITSWIQSSFSKIAKQTTEKYGEPYIAAFETK